MRLILVSIIIFISAASSRRSYYDNSPRLEPGDQLKGPNVCVKIRDEGFETRKLDKVATEKLWCRKC